MSESKELNINKKEHIWVERYRPKTIDAIVLPEHIKEDMRRWKADGQIPNMLLTSKTPGLGKTSMAHTIINELNAEVLFINASLHSNIDTLRNLIQGFVSTVSFDGRPKIVVLDEADYLNCLEENEEILLSSGIHIKLKDMNEGEEYSVISLNTDTSEFEEDTCRVINSKVDDVYRVTLDNGEQVTVTKDHPFMVLKDGNISTRTIEEGLDGFEIIIKTD